MERSLELHCSNKHLNIRCHGIRRSSNKHLNRRRLRRTRRGCAWQRVDGERPRTRCSTASPRSRRRCRRDGVRRSSSCSPRASGPSRRSPVRSASRSPTPPTTCAPSPERGCSPADAPARTCTTASPPTTSSSCGGRCARSRPHSSTASTARPSLPRGSEGIPTVTDQELLERLERGDVVIIDVRPEAEYAAGHLPGAIHVPPTGSTSSTTCRATGTSSPTAEAATA
jgi:hypothetical protein